MVDSIAASDLQGAGHDALAALHLLHFNTGLLGNFNALFELRHCKLSAANREKVLAAAKAELAAEAAETAAAQPGIIQAYRDKSNEKPRHVRARAACSILTSCRAFIFKAPSARARLKGPY